MVNTPDGWVSLKEYIERIFDEREAAHQAQLVAAERSLDMAAANLEHKLSNMNEFRTQIQDERMNYVRMDKFQLVLDRLRHVEENDANRNGRQAVVMIGVTIVAGLLATLLSIVARHMGL